jgi:hypothetical protein
VAKQHSKGQHTHETHAHHFVQSLSANQRNSLRILLIKNAARELHHALDLQKAITRSVHSAEHALELAKQGRTAELFRSSQHAADIRVRL